MTRKKFDKILANNGDLFWEWYKDQNKGKKRIIKTRNEFWAWFHGEMRANGIDFNLGNARHLLIQHIESTL